MFWLLKGEEEEFCFCSADRIEKSETFLVWGEKEKRKRGNGRLCDRKERFKRGLCRSGSASIPKRGSSPTEKRGKKKAHPAGRGGGKKL